MNSSKKILVFGKTIALVLSILTFLSPFSIFASSNNSFIVGKSYFGFRLLEESIIDEIDSIVRVFEHTKTGAKLISLNNDDDNKVFTINFRTPQENSTGIPHIIEHSVLDGSKNFPIKSPFGEMGKRSLSTFLNALTHSDRTAYPVSSRNEKDFKNLMNVYLDAVFYPNFLHDERIFMQEGWSYSLNSVNDEITYNGVVYNEMQGSYSNPSKVLYNQIMKSLYPDTIYSNDSSGDPSEIPNLAYEEYVNFHKTYYHPSNSFMYLYGNLNLLDTLKFIDEEYLNQFNKKEIDSVISMQKPFCERVYEEAFYSLPENTDPTNKSYLSLNYVVGDTKDKELYLGFSILSSLLLNGNSSPLKLALQQEGIGTNIYGQYSASQIQPFFSIIIENASKENAIMFEQSVENNLNQLVKKGLDKNLINSVISSLEINLRASKSSADRGLGFNDNIMTAWNYDMDPTLYLTFEKELSNIKKKAENGYFEELIEKYLINNPHSSLVILNPIMGLETQNQIKLQDKLKEYKESLSEKELLSLVEQTKEIEAWKNTPNSKEDLAKLPSLSLDDIDIKENPFPTDVEKLDEITILNHPLYTNKIAYINFYFDTTKISQEKLSYLFLLPNIIGMVDTENYTYQDLFTNIMANVGQFNCYPAVYTDYEDYKLIHPKMVISTYTLSSNVSSLLSLLDEIVNKSKLDNVERLKEVISEIRGDYETALNSNGINIAKSQLESYFLQASRYENLGTLEQYQFILQIQEELNTNPENVIKNLQEVHSLAFDRKNLLIGVTVDSSEYNNIRKSLIHFSETLKTSDLEPQTYYFPASSTKQGVINGEKIQYVGKGYNFRDLGYDYSGKMQVLRNIIALEYLWNELRVKGGAYDFLPNISENGNLYFITYRDPNLKESLSVFDKIPAFLNTFNADEQEMTNYIIGTFKNYDPLLNPSQKGDIGDSFYITGKSNKDYIKEQKEILNTTTKDIKNYAILIADVMKQDNYCIVGNEGKIKESKEIFDEVLEVFNIN
ncbi:MAG: insulinase family protein [Epulopiscium sp.]|nr:insulinase family protein [Candidatus Epulonipiscium sp.]